MRAASRYWLVTFTVVVAGWDVGCGAGGDGTADGTTADDRALPATPAASEYQAAAARWSARAPSSYVFIWYASASSGASRVRTVVQDRMVVSAATPTGVSGAETSVVGAALGVTVDDLLREARDDLAGNYYKLTIAYDTTWGYPSWIELDASTGSDDETSLAVECFEPGSGEARCPL